MMNFLFGTSPRTTLVGYLGAGAIGAIGAITHGGFSPEAIATAVVVAILGRFAKDAGVTGAGS